VDYLNKYKIDEMLENYLAKETGECTRLQEAMRYSVLQGGKRIRPILMRLAYEAVGGTGNIAPYMCAIEFVHTYSLIHDDLPAMDNDALRRGLPTNHVKFDEATAILAGDGLLTLAFEIMLQDLVSDMDPAKAIAANILATGAGASGMVLGQMYDMFYEGKEISIEMLEKIQLNKTGALIKSALKMGAVLGYGSESELFALELYGTYLGKVFQIIDDILDITGQVNELGKDIGSDSKNKKVTYTSFFSVDQCYEIAAELTAKAIKCLDKVNGDTSLLKEIAQDLLNRRR